MSTRRFSLEQLRQLATNALCAHNKHHRTTETYLHSIDNAAREAMRSVEGQFSVKTTTQNHNQNEDETIRKDVSY
jgi:hypothetical protein